MSYSTEGVEVVTLSEIEHLVRREMRGKFVAGTELTPETRLDELGLSSLQVSEIVFSLEEEHGIEFDTARAADVKTLGDVIVLANESLDAQLS